MKCTIKTEGFGNMVFDLFPDLAPITVTFLMKETDKFVYFFFYYTAGVSKTCVVC